TDNQIDENVDLNSTLAFSHFPPEVLDALVTIKTRFEQGLRIGKEQRSVGYAYEQHAIRMRLDFFDKAQITNNYPYNGQFSLAEVKAAVDQLPFFTDKCGFAVGEQDQVVNYYCPALDENYFSYLGQLSDPEGIISTFVSNYREAKTITPMMRQKMVMSAQESLDFDNWDHQLFYCLFQCWVNEEVQAYIEVNVLRAEMEMKKDSVK
ncbi:MAG: hypothetical protein AAF597_21405, partial [Bacteroidota bacterium]